MKPETRRVLVALVAALFVASVGAAALQPRSRIDRAAAEVSVVTKPAVEPAPAPTTTTTTAAAAPAAAPRQARPANVPADPYANEPVVEIGTIEIPKIGLVHPIYEGITLRNIDHGPSHWPGTAMPGEVGNAVFAGHRVTHTHPFLRIDELAPGDEVIFTVRGVRSVYVVSGHEIVTPKELGIVNQTSTPTATLFACHPPHSASYRYVVHLDLKAS